MVHAWSSSRARTTSTPAAGLPDIRSSTCVEIMGCWVAGLLSSGQELLEAKARDLRLLACGYSQLYRRFVVHAPLHLRQHLAGLLARGTNQEDEPEALLVFDV